jgi:hypothetical protein
MGLGDDLKDFENDATGQGGNDGDNNANNANGSNDKTEDTLADSGNYTSSPLDSVPMPIRFRFSFLSTSPGILTRIAKHTKHITGILLMHFNLAIDQIASKEGIPAGFDPEINNLANDAINKF